MLYDALFRHVLTRIDPERAHHLGAAMLTRLGEHPQLAAALHPAPELAITAFGRRFASPLCVAAGLDKDATFYRGLGALGFGGVEIGTVTPRPQPGNPRPRIVRALPDRALVNAMGFPSEGMNAVAARLPGRAAPSEVPGNPIVGANVGKNRDTPLERAAEDYVAVAATLGPRVDYLVLNVSSPNTPGLRALEQVDALAPIVAAVQAEVGRLPLLVKISPDLADADVDAVADLARDRGLAGVIATNTTVARERLSPAAAAAVAEFAGGGVSGPPLAERSLEVLRRLSSRLRGSDTIVVSAGGVSGAADVWARILAGATLVQAYTAFVYGGPAWPARVNRALAGHVRTAGTAGIGQLVGIGV